MRVLCTLLRRATAECEKLREKVYWSHRSMLHSTVGGFPLSRSRCDLTVGFLLSAQRVVNNLILFVSAPGLRATTKAPMSEWSAKFVKKMENEKLESIVTKQEVTRHRVTKTPAAKSGSNSRYSLQLPLEVWRHCMDLTLRPSARNFIEKVFLTH